MKKLMFLVSTVLFTLSCSSSDDNSSNNSNNSPKITPPTWIQGNWTYVDFPASYSYRLSANNLCQITIASEVCMKEYIELYQNTNVVTNVEQRISESEYYCKITVQGTSNIYHFEKISNNTIKDVIMSTSVGSTVILKRD